eukprot:GILI01007532.1.p1 GENE.GILI01007532.1~~GILI01007532.1.p1  ORF type:complete len:612 (-),score=169.44 GILI01007532.1:358-2103(-)
MEYIVEKGNGIIGIRREDKNKWERRVPIAPEHVSQLVAKGIKVIVQPSTRRCYADCEFEAAGAVISEDLSPAGTILAVKEVPIPLLMPGKTYMFFSHTIKAQQANMPLLDAILEKKIRVIDYECITENPPANAPDAKGKRLVAFGRFAGLAGMIDYIRGLGERLLTLGYSTPFLSCGSSYMYIDLEDAKEAIRKIGREILRKGLPEQLCPMTFVFTGTGNVSLGAQEIFELLPHEYVSANDLPALMAKKDRFKVYGVVATAEDMVAPRDPSQPFDKAQYYRDPNSYAPIFHEKVAPYMSVLVHCMYWDRRFPRLLSCDQIADLESSGRNRLLGVCDITCDFEGSVEFLKKFTSIEHPFYIYNPNSREISDDLEHPGILYMAVDHLPAELPKEASMHFGNNLMAFLPALANSDATLPFDQQLGDLPAELHRACLTSQGRLTPCYQYIATLRALNEANEKKEKEAEEEQAKTPKGLRRSTSMVSVALRGHLFDKGLINKALNILEANSVQFRMLDWEVGQNQQQQSRVVIQIITHDEKIMHAVVQQITAAAEESSGVVIETASGPSLNSSLSLLVHDVNRSDL